MSRLLAWPVLASLGAGAGTLLLVRLVWRVRDRPGARWFLLTLGAQATMCFAYAGAMVVADPAVRLALEMVSVAAVHWVGVAFLGFALEYTGRSDLVDSWYYRTFVVFLLAVTALVLTNPLHGLVWTRFEPTRVLGVVGASYTNGPVLFAGIAGATVATATGTLLLFETFVSYGPLYRGEAFAVGVSPIPPAVGIVAWLFGLGPVPALNLTTALFLPHVLLDAYAFVWSDMFEFHPATRRAAERSALDDLDNPVVVLDGEERVVDYNDAATGLLDRAESDGEPGAVAEPLSAVLDAALDVEGGSQRVSLTRDGRPREYRVTPADLTDSGGNHVGYTLVFQDVTKDVRRERRLGVLNRVLRHNLRNDLTVVKGNVDAARERSDREDVADLLETAGETASKLADTGEKARVVAEAIREGDATASAVDVRALCEEAVAPLRERFPAASVTVTGDAGEVRSDPKLLGAIVENLVENACEHGDAPAVTVAVEASETGAVVRVADDGPGIPDGELRPIRAGEETSLEHGSGFGLWLVRWGAELLGGEATFETGDGGTTVTVRVPDQGRASGQ